MVTTIVLIDSSVANIYPDGQVEFYGSEKWKRSGLVYGRGETLCHIFKFGDAVQANKIVKLLNSELCKIQ